MYVGPSGPLSLRAQTSSQSPGSNLNVLLPVYSLSLLWTCPNHASQASLASISKTIMMHRPSDVLPPDSFHPGPSQREAKHVNLHYQQLCLMSFPQYHSLGLTQHD